MRASALQSSEGKAAVKKQKPAVQSVSISPWIPQTLSVEQSLIQRKASCACGGGCPHCQTNLPIQKKLAVNRPGDEHEQEADRIADEVIRAPGPTIQRSCTSCAAGGSTCAECASEEKPQVQTKRAPSSGQSAASLPDNFMSNLGTGQPLDAATRAFFEPRFGHDFSGVRVHTDAKAAESARAVNARAYTLGRDVFFGESEYAPGGSEGKRLLAHELTHVLQQNSAGVGTSGTSGPNLIQRANLASPRMAGNPLFEAVLDNTDVIELGDTGPEVRRIQQLLIDLGFSFPVDGANGTFGAETEAAVKAFQGAHPPLTVDGRVGFNTIRELDRAFPSFTLPAGRSNPWTMSCVLDILCPWNRHLVENVLPTFNIITFDSREFPTETWNGHTWVAGTFHSGGFTGGTNMGFLNTVTCEEFALTVYHEGWHGQQPSGLTGVVDTEKDAYINTEQWSISAGIPGQTFDNTVTGNTEDLRDTSGSGETIVDEAAAETLVRQDYGGVSSVPGERILRRVGASDVRVRKPDGLEETRPARAGESVRGTAVMTNLQTIAPTDWDCP